MDWKTSLCVIFTVATLVVSMLWIGQSTTPDSGPYYLTVPFSSVSYIIDSFANGTIYAVNGSDWNLCDYGTNASVIINNACGNLTSGGAILLKGSLTIDGTLTVTYSISFYGEGSSSVLQWTRTGTQNMFQIDGTNVTFRDLRFVCYTATTGSAINVTATGKYLTVDHCWFDGWSADGASHGGIFCAQYCKVVNSYFQHVHDGVTQTGTDFQCIVEGNHFIDCHDGVHVGTLSVVVGNSFYADDASIAGGCDTAIGFEVGSRSIISGNVFFGTSSKSWTVAIALTADDDLVSNNYIRYCTTGISLGAATDRAQIQTNIIWNCTTGISIASGATANVIKNNEFYYDTTIISNSGTNTIIKYNVGYVTENIGSTASCVNGTWIAHGLAATPTTVEFQVNGTRLINSTCYVIDPTVIAQNTTYIQIEFLANNNGEFVAVAAAEAKTIIWTATYKP